MTTQEIQEIAQQVVSYLKSSGSVSIESLPTEEQASNILAVLGLNTKNEMVKVSSDNLGGSTIKVVWSNDSAPLSNMNDFTTAGVYELSGEHTRNNDNLPIANIGSGHTFNARLTVLDSSIDDTTNSDDKCITQILSMSNRVGGDGKICIRTAHGRTKDELTWDAWAELQTNVNVGQVGSLDTLIDNGIYSGVWTNGSYGSYPLTFVCVVINDYFIGTSPRRVSQFLYGLSKFDGSVLFKTRVGVGDTTIEWSDWKDINEDNIKSIINDEAQRAKKIEERISSSLSIQTVRIGDIISHLNSGLKSDNKGLICKPDISQTTIVRINKLPAQKYTFYTDINNAIDGDIVFKLVKNDNVIVTIGTILGGDISFENVINIEEDYEDVQLHIIAPIVQERTYVDVYYSFIPEKTISKTINEEVNRAINAEEKLQANIDNKDFDILQRTTITLVDNQDTNNRGKTPKVFKTGDVVKFELSFIDSPAVATAWHKTFDIYVRVGNLQKKIGSLSSSSPHFTHIFSEDCYDNSIWCWSTDGEKTDNVLTVVVTQLNSEIQNLINSNDNAVVEYLYQHLIKGKQPLLQTIKKAGTRVRVEWVYSSTNETGTYPIVVRNAKTHTSTQLGTIKLNGSLEFKVDYDFDLIGINGITNENTLRITWLDSPIAKLIEEKAGNTKVVDLGNIGYIEDDGYLDNVTEEGVYSGLGSYTVGSYERITNFKLTVYKQYNVHGYAQICQLLTMFIPFSSVTIIKGRSFLDGEWTEWVYPNSFAWDEIESSLTKYKMETNKRLKAIEDTPFVTTEPTDEAVEDVPEYITRKDLDNAILEAITNTLNTAV
jgi:hypothetical protein